MILPRLENQEVYALANIAIDGDGQTLIKFLSRAREKFSEDAEEKSVEESQRFLAYARLLRELVKTFADAKDQQHKLRAKGGS